MKKYFDKVIISRMWLQLLLAILIVIIVWAAVTPIAQLYMEKGAVDKNFYTAWLWGLLHLCDGGFIGQTIASVHGGTQESAKNGDLVIFVSLFIWICGAVLFCFITGAISNAFEVRRALISGGHIRYKFKGRHGVVIGWNFQGVTTVNAMKEIYGVKEIIILSSISTEVIREQLGDEFSPKDMKTVFIHRGGVFDKNELAGLSPWNASVVMILGDSTDNNDGGNHRIYGLLPRTPIRSAKSQVFMEKIKRKFHRTKSKAVPYCAIPCFIGISNPYDLVQDEFNIQTINRDPKVTPVYNPRVLNFYKQSVNEVLSSMPSIQSFNKGKRKDVYEPQYHQLAFRRNPEAAHVHILVADFDEMAHMFIIQASKILLPGKEKHQITVFTDKSEDIDKFRNFYPLEKLHGIQFNFRGGSISCMENRQYLVEVVRDISASVTLFIANPTADLALEAFNRLPDELHFENIRILIEQQIMAKCTKPPYSLRRLGYAAVDYVGMIDRFYYSLAGHEEMAWSFNAAQVSDQMLFHNWRVKNSSKQHEDTRAFVDSFLEKLYTVDLEFDMISADDSIQPINDLQPYLKQLAQAEHARWVNSRTLAGYHHEQQSNDRYFASSKLIEWEKLSVDEQQQYESQIEQILPIVNRTFNHGKYPYSLFPKRFRRVLGIVNDNMPQNINWSDESNYYFQRVIRKLITLNRTTVRRENKSPKTYPSMAICCTLSEGWSEMFVNMAMREQIPIIAILPEPPELYQMRFEEGWVRDRFWQRLRNVWTYYVIDQSIPPEEREQTIRELIIGSSDEIWCAEEFRLNSEKSMEYSAGFKFLPKRKCFEFKVVTTKDDGEVELKNFCPFN